MNGRFQRRTYRRGGFNQAPATQPTNWSPNYDDSNPRPQQGYPDRPPKTTDLDELRSLFQKMSTELEQVKSRLRQLESATANNSADIHPANKNHHQGKQQNNIKQQQQQNSQPDNQQQNHTLTNKPKVNKQRRLSQPYTANRIVKNPEQQSNNRAPRNQNSDAQSHQQNNNNNNNNTPTDPSAGPKSLDNNHLSQQNYNNKNNDSQPGPPPPASTPATTTAGPATSDGPTRNHERPPRFKKNVKNFIKKPNHKRTSRIFNDVNQQQQNQDHQHQQREYSELSESEMNEVVQTLKREFFVEPNNLFKRSLREIKYIFNDKGPKVVFEFVCSILDHALCDVTSPTQLTKIANRFYQLLVSDEEGYDVDFQQGFFEALTDVCKREDDIAIDAPRYMDTLGQVLGECIIPMNKNKHRHLIKSFLKRCLDSYCEKNRAVLLASIMVSIAGSKGDRFARSVWDNSELQWQNVIVDGVDVDEFMESHEVSFTTRKFSPRTSITDRKDPKELEKFADDVTNLVEKRCSCQTLDDLVKDLSLEESEKIDYLGTLIYAIVRGCLDTNSGDCKLNNEALNKYSSILTTKHDEQEAIALYALTALTKWWHFLNCPQDLLRTILMALHNHGTAPYNALDEWLNSESLTNIPGIGAARLNSKRYIEDLKQANLKQSSSSN